MSKSKTVTFVLILLSSLLCSVGIQHAKSQSQAAISIAQDGSVNPSSAPVQRFGNTYYLTENTSQPLVIERDSIVFDGNGYTFYGDGNNTGINLLCRNIVLKNTRVTNWETAIQSNYGYNTITSNYVTSNYYGVVTCSDSSSS